MTYLEFRKTIQAELARHPSGCTWKELQANLHLPYDRPCPEWIARLELEIGLVRKEKRGNALLWQTPKSPRKNADQP